MVACGLLASVVAECRGRLRDVPSGPLSESVLTRWYEVVDGMTRIIGYILLCPRFLIILWEYQPSYFINHIYMTG